MLVSGHLIDRLTRRSKTAYATAPAVSLLLVMNFIGLGLGPTFVGAASDFFRATHPHHSLQIALYALTPFYVIAILIFVALAGVLQRESRAAASGP